MAIDTIGGREYYTHAIKSSLTSGNFNDVPANTKAILFPVLDDYIWKFAGATAVDDITITMEPAANQIVNIIPSSIAVHDSQARDIYFLF